MLLCAQHPHPNPHKAAEGDRIRVLAVEDTTAEAVRRIFAEYLDGKGDRAIAAGLPPGTASRAHR